MPYCEPHHTARMHIVDLEILRLELRALRPEPRRRAVKRATLGRGARMDGSTPPRVV